MVVQRECPDCKNKMPISRVSCPHCGRPQFFPNVDLASSSEETEKLRNRFETAMQDCRDRNVEEIAKQFFASCESTVAVFACTLLKLHREIASLTEVFETYYDLEQLKLNAASPSEGDLNWAKLRPQAEIELLGDHINIDKLHYACLSLNGEGLESYGDCLVELDTKMIAHRASCFEGNTAVIYNRFHSFSEFVRSTWADRARLCLAVCGERINQSCTVAEFPAILNVIRDNPISDDFIEVHVIGPMTSRSFRAVRVNVSAYKRRDKLLLKAIREKNPHLAFEEFRS